MSAVRTEKNSRSASTASLLPWLMLANEDASLVACKDSSILGAWEVDGLDLESSDEDAMESCMVQLDGLYRRLAESGISVWTSFSQAPFEDYPYGEFSNPIAGAIDQAWGETFKHNKPFRKRIFFTASMPTSVARSGFGTMVADRMATGQKPLAATISSVRDLMSGAKRFGFSSKQDLAAACMRFEALVGAPVKNAVSRISMRRLSGDDLLGFLKWSGSVNDFAPVQASGSVYLDAALADTEIDNRYADYLILRGHSTQYVAAFSLKVAPGPHKAGALAALMALPIKLRVSNCWRPVSGREADKIIAGARTWDEMRMMTPRRLIKSMMDQSKGVVDYEDVPKTQIGAVAQAYREDVRRNKAFFGWSAWVVTVYADDPEQLERHAELVLRALEQSKLVFMRETDGSLSAWCTGIAGHWAQVVRWHLTEASNQSEATPVIAADSGEPTHPFFSEMLRRPMPPNATFRTRYGTIQYFNYHVGQLGHTLFIGPSRAGKTMLQMFLESQFFKYPNAMVYNFDKDFSCYPPTMLMDGRHIDLSPSSTTGGIRLNPMLECVNDMGRMWLLGWIDRLMQSRGPALTDRQLNTIDVILRNFGDQINAALSSGDPDAMRRSEIRLSKLASVLPEELSERLKTWTEDGPYGHFFDYREDDFSLTRITTTEIGSLLNAGLNDVVRAYTDYVFYRIDKYLMNRPSSEVGPTMIYFEEAGYLLTDPIFALKARDYLMTLAKKGAFLVMTAQSPEPFANNKDLAAAVRDNIATIVFLPNDSALRPSLAEQYRTSFGVNDEQLKIIASATRKMEYCVFQPSTGFFRVVRAEFPLSIVNALRSDSVAMPIFRQTFDPSNAAWKEVYLDALERL